MASFKRLACVFVIAAAALTSGCATIVKGSTQDLNVNTDPTGANCELSRAGIVIASVNPTPGSVQIKKDKNDIEVKCNKSGYAETSGHISSNFEGWTVGNILFGGIIGIAVDYGSGALNSYEPELFVKLTPEKFASSEDKADFYEKWRSDVLQNSTKAKIAASKTCVKEQCDEMSRRIDKETEQALAAIESNRNLRSSPAPSAPAPSQPQAQAQQVAARAEQTARASANTGSPRTGDKWIYQLSDNARPVGKVVIEATGVSGDQVRERITREGWPGFVAEREVAAPFNILRFQDPVKLPGGFQFAEISPYASPNADIRKGQSWSDIQGTVFIMFFGTQRFLAQAKVISKETVKVPAGTFEAWRIEAVSENQWTARTVRMKFTYWYSPDMARTVKMIMDVNPESQAHVLDSYELVSFAAGK